MITDKEYPATHSMYTSWFAIDIEGNVAILEFEDNGPVPYGIPHTICENVITDSLTETRNGRQPLSWSDEQADEFLKRLSVCRNITKLTFDCIVQIDVSQAEYFVSLINSLPYSVSKRCNLTVISASRGLYFVNFYHFPRNVRDKLRRRHVIQKFFEVSFDNDTTWDSEKEEYIYTQDFEHLPFYLYQQPYNAQMLMQRTFEPLYPFKESQLSPDITEKALRLPISFAKQSQVQVAQYYPFQSYGDCINKEGNEYYPMLLTDNSKAYVRPTTLPYIWCGHNCTKCYSDDCKYETRYTKDYYIEQYTDQPTIVIVSGLHASLENFRYDWVEKWPLLRHGANIPILHGLPSDHDLYYDGVAIRQIIQEHSYMPFLMNCKTHLENILDIIKPHALLLFNETKDILSRVYDHDDDTFTINNVTYPFFLFEELKSCYNKLRVYAERPYRGQVISRISTDIHPDEPEKPDKLEKQTDAYD